MSFPADYVVNEAVVADWDAAVAADKGLVLLGYSCHESDGTPAVATIHIVEGATGAGGDQVASVKLAANAAKTIWFGDRGIAVPGGLSVDWVEGTLDIVLYYKVMP